MEIPDSHAGKVGQGPQPAPMPTRRGATPVAAVGYSGPDLNSHAPISISPMQI